MTAAGLKKRSRENLRAVEFLTSEQTLEELRVSSVTSLWNPATSRLYYSLFQAVVANFLGRKPPLTPRDINCPTDRWQHDCVQSACRGTLQNKTLGDVFRMAMALRERADYDPASPVSQGEFQEIEKKVRHELMQLGVES